MLTEVLIPSDRDPASFNECDLKVRFPDHGEPLAATTRRNVASNASETIRGPRPLNALTAPEGSGCSDSTQSATASLLSAGMVEFVHLRG